ncbi:MAG: transcriptional regulator [Micavibrio aeruginosavorus]|uniref:Transcriptional regulator n=1 Tax=Micavibrio aeruginosavorus TaxID=349221 RepID=A0A2W5MZP5_9BACT|nr:MAG: transcriptional regulator [Micavibrio aeruginosavorus]
MDNNAEKAAAFLAGLASPHRLRILCQLADGEKSVTQIIKGTGLAQTSMSQHLNKLKEEGIVSFRREHRTLYYFITDSMALEIMGIMYEHYCKKKGHKS